MTQDYYSRVYAGQEYLTPGDPEMVEMIAAERASGDPAFAERIENGVEIDRRGAATFLDYAAFVARKPQESLFA